jgi:hypothetical protein
MLISPAQGEGMMPIARTASGGELARLMLALKMALARADQVPTLIFDEVDAGIGGMTAERIGEKLAALSGFHQVICVTHLPHREARWGRQGTGDNTHAGGQRGNRKTACQRAHTPRKRRQACLNRLGDPPPSAILN